MGSHSAKGCKCWGLCEISLFKKDIQPTWGGGRFTTSLLFFLKIFCSLPIGVVLMSDQVTKTAKMRGKAR